MKRSHGFIAIAALWTVPMATSAQGIAIKGGLSYGSVPNANGVLPGTLSANSGFAIGVGITTGSIVGFGLEGLYAQRGYKSSTPGFSQKLSYIDVPLYFRVMLPIPQISPFAYAGPQGSFEKSCDNDGGQMCPSGRPTTTFAGIIGGGVKLGMLRGLSIEGRYVYGITDLKLSTTTGAVSANYQPRSFMILAGIGF